MDETQSSLLINRIDTHLITVIRAITINQTELIVSGLLSDQTVLDVKQSWVTNGLDAKP